jgi:hypothetical protein
MKRFNASTCILHIMEDEGKSRALAAAEKALLRETGSALIDFLSVEPAEWPDASMGWAEPGHAYAQMLTEGYRVMARSAGKLFECRVSDGNVRCMVLKG